MLNTSDASTCRSQTGSEISLTTVVKRGLYRREDDDEEKRGIRKKREHGVEFGNHAHDGDVILNHLPGASDEDDDTSRQLSPGRMSISDLDPIGSPLRHTDDDGASSVTSARRSAKTQSASDSDRSVCVKCGEYLDHPRYHRRYNVHGELVPCKSLYSSSNNREARPRSPPARTRSSAAHHGQYAASPTFPPVPIHQCIQLKTLQMIYCAPYM